MSAHFFHRGLGATIGARDSPVLFSKKSTKNNFTCETVFSSLLVYLVGDSCAFFHFLDGGRATWRVFLFGERRKRKKQCLSLRTNLFIPIFLSHKPKREPTEIFERDFSSLSLWERDLRLKERGRRKNCWMAVGTNYGSLDVINTLLFPLRTFFLFFFLFFLFWRHTTVCSFLFWMGQGEEGGGGEKENTPGNLGGGQESCCVLFIIIYFSLPISLVRWRHSWFLPAAIAVRSSNGPSCCCWWWWWGNVFFEDLNDVVAQSHSNNFGRSSKVRTTLLKWPLWVISRFWENHQKWFGTLKTQLVFYHIGSSFQRVHEKRMPCAYFLGYSWLMQHHY